MPLCNLDRLILAPNMVPALNYAIRGFVQLEEREGMGGIVIRNNYVSSYTHTYFTYIHTCTSMPPFSYPFVAFSGWAAIIMIGA